MGYAGLSLPFLIMKNENLENSLFETLTDNTLDLGCDISELTIDQFIENDMLKDIPFFSLFYKSFKAIQGVRETLFIMKVYKFIKEFEKIKQNEKIQFNNKITSNKKERIKVGQTLIMILDKIEEVDKTQIIANLFSAYIRSEITKSEFTKLASIAEKVFIDELLLFSKMKDYDEIDLEVQANLSSVGLMFPIIMDTKSIYGDSVLIDEINNKNRIVYVISKLGLKMKKHALHNKLIIS
ncbi:hypothetical protein KORDIASMS9_03884 [Kordia sp. SMS9]|nr:hypothetical protein KORDIASMS9_03884 [Kordia sp. SMS9]